MTPSSCSSRRRPHAQGPRAIPAPKHEQALNEVHLPESPAFNEKDLRHKALKAPNVSIKTKEDLEKSYRAELQSLQSVDDLVAAVGDALKETGKLDNTVIIYTSDNGFLLGDHRLIGKSAAYEGSIKVPLLMRGPGIAENEAREQLVNISTWSPRLWTLPVRSQAPRRMGSRSALSLPPPPRHGEARS